MLNQLEQVFSIQSTNLNDLDGDLDTTNANFMSTNILTNTSNNVITTADLNASSSSPFLANGPTNSSTSMSLINKPNPSMANSNPSKMSLNNSQMKGFSADQKTIAANASTLDNTAQKNANSNNNSILKDDDLTKQKRIEAISKHLKTDLIESFKSSNISAKLSLLQSPKVVKSANMNDSFTFNTTNSNENSFVNNQHRLNMSFPQSHPSAMIQQQQHPHHQLNKNVMYNASSLQHLDDNNVPNLTIDQMNSFPFQPQQHHVSNQPQQHTNSMHNMLSTVTAPASQPPPPPLSSSLPPTNIGYHLKSNRRMSLVAANLPANQINQMQIIFTPKASQ